MIDLNNPWNHTLKRPIICLVLRRWIEIKSSGAGRQDREYGIGVEIPPVTLYEWIQTLDT